MNEPIGVFDSGIGGLSVLKTLLAELPLENFIYIADSGHAPYGEKDEEHVLTRSRAIVQYLVECNVKALVIACNTATAAAVDLLRDEHPGLVLIGVEPALKPAAVRSRTGRIGVMATRSTLCSARFRTLLASQAGHATFVVQPCDGLAEAIECSVLSGNTSKTIALCKLYTGAMGRFGNQKGDIDTLVLGCTHFPFASEQLHALLGPEVQIIDNGEAIARQTRRRLHITLPASDQPPGQVSLFTTGQPQALQAAARRWLGLPAQVDLLCF